jgi:hypothetical protein
MAYSHPTSGVFFLLILGLFEALIVLATAWIRAQTISLPPLLFIPVAFIYFYVLLLSRYYAITTGVLMVDFALGTVILSHAIYAFDGFVLTDVQRVLYKIGGKPGQITLAPFTERLIWGAHLLVSPRGIGWGHEIPHVRSSDSRACGRAEFVLSRLSTLARCRLIAVFVLILYHIDPTLSYGVSSVLNRALYRRAALSVLSYAASFISLNALHCIAGIVLVGTGFSTPADWPPIFGPLSRAYTLQNFWRWVVQL